MRSIDDSCQNLISVLEAYQDRVFGLAHEESAAGRFLKECGKVDKTRAGKMMTASGKTLCYTAQQRIQLRNPLVRLYQEVETFQYRAVADTMITIDKMEKARTAYRAALLWMKDISQQLDPDTYKQLEKFRKVQSHVRRTKARFDKLKLDTLQKVDLLSASRCNMYSHALVGYQTALLQFWEKTSRTMNAVAEGFKGYQYYEFTLLRELTETSKKLAEETANCEDIRKIFDETEDDDDKDRLIFFESEYRDNDPKKSLNKDSTNKKGKNVAKRISNLAHNKPKPSKLLDKDMIGEPNGGNSLLDLTFDQKENKIDNNIENHSNTTQTKDILTSSDLKVDDLTLLNEILNAPTTPVIEASLTNTSSTLKSDLFMPSQLLDFDHSLANNYLNPINNSIPISDKNEEKKKINSNISKEKVSKISLFHLIMSLICC